MKYASILRRFTLLISILLIFGFNTMAANNSKFLPLTMVRPGMKGVAYTVISGDKIESFNVRVVGILAGSGPVKNLILVQVSGRSLNEFGGIAAGMSGSPVYINNKLVGAIGYGFQNADPRYALVTPIEDMMQLLQRPSAATSEKLTWVDGSIPGYRGVSLGNRDFGDSWLKGVPVETPIMVGGLGKRAFRSISGLFNSSGVKLINLAGRSRGDFDEVKMLVPGSAVGIQVVTGDYEVSAIGTLTWIEDGIFLAFGHPFLNKGDVDYYVTGAHIYKTIGSSAFPFKLGETSAIVGRLTQDRGAGVAGILGQVPEQVTVKVNVSYATQKSKTFQFRVAYDDSLMKGLIVAGALQAIDQTLDRIGSGTAEVQARIIGDGFTTIERSNLFYSQDIAASSLKEVNKLLELLINNEFHNIRLRHVEINVKIDPERKSARILEAAIKNGKEGRKFQPGDNLQLEISILPYRNKKEFKLMNIALPNNLKPGRWLLSVHGGGFSTTVAEKDSEKKDSELVNWNKFNNLQEEVDDFLSQPTNNMLVVEALPLNGETPEGQSDPTKELAQQNSLNKWTLSTHYYLSGESQIMIDIAPKS